MNSRQMNVFIVYLYDSEWKLGFAESNHEDLPNFKINITQIL